MTWRVVEDERGLVLEPPADSGIEMVVVDNNRAAFDRIAEILNAEARTHDQGAEDGLAVKPGRAAWTMRHYTATGPTYIREGEGLVITGPGGTEYGPMLPGTAYGLVEALNALSAAPPAPSIRPHANSEADTPTSDEELLAWLDYELTASARDMSIWAAFMEERGRHLAQPPAPSGEAALREALEEISRIAYANPDIRTAEDAANRAIDIARAALAPQESPSCPLCAQPSPDGNTHRECELREQAEADR